MISLIVLSLISPAVLSFLFIIGAGLLSLISLRKKISKIIFGISSLLFVGIFFSQLPFNSNIEDKYLSEEEQVCVSGVTKPASFPAFVTYDILLNLELKGSRPLIPVFKIKVNSIKSQDDILYVNFTLYSFWRIPIGTRNIQCNVI